jgi:hypothetical protein
VKVNLALVWTMLTGTIAAMILGFQWITTGFVASEDFEQFSVEIYYDQYYSILKDYREAELDGETDWLDELGIRLERLKTKICAIDPEWERCDNGQ